MSRYIRIIKADEEEGEEAPKARPKRPKISTEKAIQLGRRGLRRFMKNLQENPPRHEEGQVPAGQPDDINYDLLYNTILYANNIMFADLFDMDEEARFKSLPEEGKASIMSQPMLTKPVLSHLDKMIDHFGEELAFRKTLDEEDHGSLEEFMKRNFVPHDMSYRIQEGLNTVGRGREKAQRNVLRSLKGLSSHPISGTTLQDMEDVKVRGIRVVPSRMRPRGERDQKMPAAFQADLDELAGRSRQELGALTTDKRRKDQLDAARRLYEEKIFPNIDMKERDVKLDKIKGSGTNIGKWRDMIEAKARNENVSLEQAVPLVQEDLNNHMRIFLQSAAVGSAGRGGKFGEVGRGRETPSLVTPSFYLAAKAVGKIIDKPNAPDNFTRFFLRGDKPNKVANRLKMADSPPTAYEDEGFELHPAITQASSESGIFRQVAESEGKVARAASPSARSTPSQEAERAGETTAVGTDMSDMKLETEEDRARMRRFISTDRGERSKARDAVKQDYRLVDLENMRRYGEIDESEYQYHLDKVRNTTMSEYSPTYFSEIPDGRDFPEGHPYRDLSEGEIEAKARTFMDMLVGSGRHIAQFKSHLHELGLPYKEIKSLKIHAKDMENLHEILHDDNPYDALAKYSDAQQKKYGRIMETGVTAGYLNKLNKDLVELRQVAEEIGIDPIDIAEMGMQYADSGFTTEGYNDAFQNMFGKYGGDVQKGPILRVLHAWRRSNEARAMTLERQEAVREQNEPFFKHYQMSPEERKEHDLQKQECKACAPKYFSHEGPNKAHPQLNRASPYVMGRVMMPQLNMRWDSEAKKSVPIKLAGGDKSLLNIAAFIFHDHDEDDYIEDMLQKYGLTDKEGDALSDDEIDARGERLQSDLIKKINRAVKDPSSPHHHRAEMIGKEFGLDMRDKALRSRGFARRTPAQRQALGLIHPSSFLNDAQRERTRLQQLHSSQFAGIIEAFDILQDAKSGALTDEKGKQWDIASLKSRKARREFVRSMFGKANEASRKENTRKRVQAFANYLRQDFDNFKDYEADWDAQYKQRVKNGDLSKKANEEGYKEVMRRKKQMHKQFAEDIRDSLNRLKSKTMSLAKNGKAGDRHVEMSQEDFLLHSMDANKLNISLGGQPNQVIDTRPPKREGDTYKLILAEPLEGDIYATEFTNDDGKKFDRTELQITDKNHSNRVLSFDMKSKHMLDALDGNIDDVGDFISAFEKKVKYALSRAERLANDVDFNQHRSSMAFGAFLKAGKELIGLLKEKDSRALFDKLSALTRDVYTDADGRPIDDVFMADGFGNEHRNFMYRPDTYLTGELGQTGGTGVAWFDNRHLGYRLTDAEELQALSLKHNGVKLSDEQLKMAKDAFHNADYSPFQQENEESLMGELSDEEKEMMESDDGDGEGMPEHKVRELIQRQAFDMDGNQQHWVRNSATGCGLCGGNGKVPLDEAIAFIQANNPTLRGANPNSQRMKDHIAQHLRPANFEEFGAHENESGLEPNEWPGVACPECDQEHPDSNCGRVSDGICAHCHGSGELDPDRVDDYFGEYTDEDGNVYHGKKHSPHYGEHYDETALNNMIKQRLRQEGVGKTAKSNFAAQMHRDAVKRGLIAPLTKLKYIQNLNKKRYAEKPKIKKTREDFDMDAYKYANSAVAGFEINPLEEDEETTPIDDAMQQISGPSLKLMEPREKAHHEKVIMDRAQMMAKQALKHGANQKDIDEQMAIIAKYAKVGALARAHKNPSHEVIKASNKLHEMATMKFPQQGSKDARFGLEESKITSSPNITHEKLHYHNGRWLTDAEKDEGLFDPYSNARPHLSIRDLRDMFAHSKPLIAALNRYLEDSDFDPEKGEAVMQLVAASKKPLVQKQLGGISHPDLDKLYDEFHASEDEREHQNVDMEEPMATWDAGLLDEMHAAGVSPSKVQEYFSLERDKDDPMRFRSKRKGLNEDYNTAIRDIVQPMFVEYATLSMVKKFLNSYDDISHPNFHKKVVAAMKEEGNSPDTRLGVENFFEITRMRGDLQKFAYNEAARMFGYEDYEDLESKLDMTKQAKDMGDGRMSGFDFKQAALQNAKVLKNKKQALPMDAQQLYEQSVADKMSLDPDAQMRDENIVAQMEEMALYRHYPNWMRSQALTNIIAENGYGDSSEFMDAVNKGKVPQEVLAQVQDVNAKSRMFHPTLAWSSYDDMEDFDAMMHERHRFDESKAKLEGAQGPLMPSQRQVGVQTTVGPQLQPQPQTGPAPMAPQGPASNVPPNQQPLGFNDARQTLPSQVANFPEQFPPLPDEDSQ